MTVLGIILFLIFGGIFLSIAGFLISLAVACVASGWSLASALVCRLRYGSWSKPVRETPHGIDAYN